MGRRWVWVAILTCFIGGCGKTEPPRSGGRTASYWVEVLQQPDPDVELRRKAALKLGPLVLKDNAVIPALLAALKDTDSQVRSAALRSLSIYSGGRGKEVLPAVSEVQQQDPDPNVREAAAKAVNWLTNGPPKRE